MFVINILVFDQLCLMVVKIYCQKLYVLIKFAIASVKGNNYKIHFWDMSKDEAMKLIKKDDLNLKN